MTARVRLTGRSSIDFAQHAELRLLGVHATGAADDFVM
jgi:hypothetical protein